MYAQNIFINNCEVCSGTESMILCNNYSANVNFTFMTICILILAVDPTGILFHEVTAFGNHKLTFLLIKHFCIHKLYNSQSDSVVHYKYMQL